MPFSQRTRTFGHICAHRTGDREGLLCLAIIKRVFALKLHFNRASTSLCCPELRHTLDVLASRLGFAQDASLPLAPSPLTLPKCVGSYPPSFGSLQERSAPSQGYRWIFSSPSDLLSRRRQRKAAEKYPSSSQCHPSCKRAALPPRERSG